VNARDEILARARRALATPPRVEPPPPPAPAAPPADVIALLADRLVDYKATVRRCLPAEVAGAVAGFLAEASAVAAPADLPDEWLAGYPGTVLRDGSLTVADLDAPGLAAVTGCAVAIAETGTIILDTGPRQGRRLLTLVPDHHVCVVPASSVAASVPEGFGRLPDPRRPITLVSGPSATSDIELNRVEGVHGPRRLDVVILQDT
jgi:L-lactate dehydrogenase complex protein LldG